MSSPASVAKHPIHPMLVVFPIGLWTFSLVCDVAYVAGWGGPIWNDMALYTMVKTTTFNGVRLPSIAIWNSESDALRVVREFGYEDFEKRLS